MNDEELRMETSRHAFSGGRRLIGACAGWIAAIAIALFALPVACTRGPAPEPESYIAGAGETLFQLYCTTCHSESGRGSELGPSLLTPQAARRSPREIERSITEGSFEAGMPAFGGPMSTDEIQALVVYVRQLQRGARRSGGAAARAPSASTTDEASGEVSRGEAIFRGKGACIECHSIDRSGGVIGPDLDGLAARLTSPEIYAAIAFPGSEIAEGYDAKEIVMKDGSTVRARYRRETAQSIQLLEEDGNLWRTYLKSNLTSVGSDSVSLMPDDLLSRLRPEETRALLSFLGTLK